jgi:hypothetical protein
MIVQLRCTEMIPDKRGGSPKAAASFVFACRSPKKALAAQVGLNL